MKRPEQTLLVLAHETCSTLDMQLVLHKWLAGVCLSYYSQYLICNELSTIWLSSLWFVFIGKNGTLFEIPKPRKTCNNKVEASNLFLQGVFSVIWYGPRCDVYIVCDDHVL